MIDNFTKVCDFEIMYKYINCMGPEIGVLRLNIMDKAKLKSNHYYLQVVIGRLPNLSILKLHQPNFVKNVDEGCLKFLQKGLNYMSKNNHRMLKLHMNSEFLTNDINKNNLYPCLKHMPSIQILKFNNMTLDL